MNDDMAEERTDRIELDLELPEPPLKVWRAVSMPALRDCWLPDHDLVDPEAVIVTPGREIRYRLRDIHPPFLESLVILTIEPNASGGTHLRILQEPLVVRDVRPSKPANRNGPLSALAA